MSSAEACRPAPYGRACVACSRAKCKCFQRSGGPGCERCHRLGKSCEPAVSVRKRRVREPTTQQQQDQQEQAPVQPTETSNRIEEKLDALVNLLQSQSSDRDSDSLAQQIWSTDTNRTQSIPMRPYTPATAQEQAVALDTSAGILYLVPPQPSSLLILEDISVHQIPETLAQAQLETFKSSMLVFYPCFHIPPTMRASELRRQRPFLWLVIMSLGSKNADDQFKMEETIWHIISRRIVCEHLADMDLLLGLMCFASWSLYFKQDKPIIGMLTQCALAMATEIGLHQETTPGADLRDRVCKKSRSQQAQLPRLTRTLEERRAFVALYHLSSSAWSTDRKIKPIEWTPYLDKCIRILSDVSEHPFDAVLIAQVKSQLIANQVTCPSTDDVFDVESSNPLPASTISALQTQMNDIRQSTPSQAASFPPTQFYLLSAQLRIHEASFSRPLSHDQTGKAHIRRLQDLNAALTCAELWASTLWEMPISYWLGFHVDLFAQLMHCVVVFFKLSLIDEVGWDLMEVKQRADVFAFLDRISETMQNRVVPEMEIVDGTSRTSLLYRHGLFHLIKGFLMAKITTERGQQSAALFLTPESADSRHDSAYAADQDVPMMQYETFMGLMDEPWASDILNFSWDVPVDDYVTWT